MNTKITVTSTAEFKLDDYLTTSDDLRQWINHLPDGVPLTPITRDMGSQRDPMHVVVGLRATWEESR
jgi:hypothetical protein